MIAERQVQRVDIGVFRCHVGAEDRVINVDLGEFAREVNCHFVRAFQSFIPDHQLERAVTLLQQQVVDCGGLPSDQVAEFTWFGS